MAIPIPLVLGGGGLLFGLGWLLLGGGGNGGPGPRGPYTSDVPVPPQGVTWEQVDAAMCLEYEAGANKGEDLLAGVLGRLWPGVPWPAQPGDSKSVMDVQLLVGARVSVFIQKVASGQPVCGGVAPPPPPPPPSEVITDIRPFFTGLPGGFVEIPQGSNPTLAARGAYNLAQSETGKLRSALACWATTGFNLVFYSRPQPGNDYGRGQLPADAGHPAKWYDINVAWNPAHQNAEVAVQTKEKLRRQISWTGAILKNGHRGYVWVPPMKLVGQALVCTAPTWSAERNPPAEVLAALGWPGGLEELKAAWDARPMSG